MPETGHLPPERTNADYQRVLLQLVDSGLPRAEMVQVALPAAAAADNTNMLEFLLAENADIGSHAGALASAARHMAHDALSWLLDHCADVHTAYDAALIAGIASLDVTTVDMLLEGVDKIKSVAVACYPDVEGACHGNERSTRRH